MTRKPLLPRKSEHINIETFVKDTMEKFPEILEYLHQSELREAPKKKDLGVINYYLHGETITVKL